MEIKEVWFDLEKVEKKGNTTFHIENERFDKPISLKIGYEDNELKELNRKYNSFQQAFLNIDKELDLHNSLAVDNSNAIKENANKIKLQDGVIDTLNKKIENQTKEIGELYKVIADLKTTIETLSGTSVHQQEQIKQIKQKITKQPMIFSDKTFISGHERVGLGLIEIPSGEYLLISKYEVGEHNEFVTNHHDLKFERVNVSDNHYMPMYQLIGGTELDTPTATIYRDLVFIPC